MRTYRIQRKNLTNIVIAIIEEALLSGELRPGSRINEAELAHNTGISRGPIREALHQLTGEGLLVNVPSRGTYVTSWTPQQAEEAYSLRAALERFAIQLAVTRAEPEDFEALQAIVEEMERCAQEGSAQAIIRLDIRFHEQIYALSRHSLLQKMLSQLRRQVYALLALDEGFEKHRDEIACDHQEILDALKTGDPQAAGNVIVAHVLSAGAEVVEQIESWTE